MDKAKKSLVKISQRALHDLIRYVGKPKILVAIVEEAVKRLNEKAKSVNEAAITTRINISEKIISSWRGTRKTRIKGPLLLDFGHFS